MLSWLWRRRRATRGAGERDSTSADRLVEISFAAHGYTAWARFECLPDGRVHMTCDGDLVDRSTVEVAGPFSVLEAIEWLHQHGYDPSSRHDPGRFASLTLQNGGWQRHLRFHRGTRVLNDNPVNRLIDECARHLPLLIDEE